MTFEIRQGDALALLKEMPEASVQCVVTSPPYFGLRDYGTASWDGGDPACEHKGRPKPRQDTSGGGPDKGRFAKTRGTQPAKRASLVPVLSVCRCGARRIDAQIGLESSPEAFVEKIVEVFREVRRVLRPDGVAWVNLGDSYATRWGSRRDEGRAGFGEGGRGRSGAVPRGLKEKDLIGIPWMCAFALRADGWWLRSEVIWHKPNPMPESTTDRPTKAHEQVFLLTKSADYFYDAEAIKTPLSPKTLSVHTTATKGDGTGSTSEKVNAWMREHGGRYHPTAANARTVWTIASEPFAEAHFAVFPQALAERCVLAGTSPRACEKCGAPWERIIERTKMGIARSERTHPMGRTRTSGTMTSPTTTTTTGLRSTCACPDAAGSGHCLVLDPFSGAATVGIVSLRHGRRFVGLELNPEYVEMAKRRIAGPLFAHTEPSGEEAASE